MAGTPQSDWRDIGGGAASSGPKKGWQTGDEAAESSAAPSKRNIKRGVAVIALIGLAIGLGVVMYWLRPIKPACLVLIGAGYETNPLLPHNVYGWNGLHLLEKEVTQEDDLASLFRFSWSQPTKMGRVGAKPIELVDGNWRSMWDKIGISSYKQQTVAVFLSMHGIADAKEAYLIPNLPGKTLTDSYEQSRIAFRDVLESLKAVQNKKIVLLLDVSHAEIHAPLGLLHNEFVDRLKAKYEKDIEAIPHLVVICSAASDQRSWTSEELQNTVFCHYVLQGLKGADHGAPANVTAQSLFEYVQKNVDTWARTNRARKQTPILIGGEARAKGMDLVHIADAYTAPAAAPPALNLTALSAEWDRWRDLKNEQAPNVHNPHIWRAYQDTLLRYEQLIRAGDPTGKASELKNSLVKLGNDVAASRALTGAFPCLGNNFPLYRVLGFNPAKDLRERQLQDFLTALRKFDNAKTPEEQEEKAKVLARFRDRSIQEKQYLRNRLSQLILKDVQGKSSREEARMTEIEIALGAPQRPVEIHLLKMLGYDCTMDADSMRLALNVRALAEEVALSAPTDPDASENTELYAEVVASWIKKDIEAADKTRRAGEDLLFGDPKTHAAEARKKLKDAESQYLKARAKAQKAQQALAVRDEAAGELPYLARWLASAPSLSDSHKEELLGMRLAAEKVGANLALLNRTLDGDSRDELSAAEVVAQVADNAKILRDGLQATCDKLKNPAYQQRNWHAIDAALHIPPAGTSDDDLQTRQILLRKQREISTTLLKNPNPEGKTEDADPLDQRLKARRDLLRAALRSYDEIPVVDSGSVDDRVREFFLKLPKEIVAQSDMVLAKGADVAKAASRCRILPGGFAEFIRDEAKKPINPLGRQRRQRMHELLLWQAERTLADHWFEPGPRADDPWYDVTGKSYVLSATKLFEDDQIPEELFKEAERVKSKFVPAQLRFLKLGEQRWTTENEFALAFQINADRIDADRGVPEGTPMVWLEIGTGKTADKVWPRKPMTTWPKFDDAYLLEQYGVTRDSVITVKLHAVYRGQHIIETAPLIRSQPNVIVRHPPALKENTAVSVRMDSNFDYGAVSIVLDNSTSMTYLHPKKGANQKPRFEYALDALEHVLRKVPDQTSLSVFTFGTSKLNVPTLVRQPSAWQQEKLGALRAELKDTLGTNIGSPIAAGIIAAMRDGFPAGFNGPKVIVVLTDGADTASFGGDGSDVQRIRDELRAANAKYPDVSVVMVLFLDKDADGESKKEFKSAEDQFKEIELFKPRGVFLPVPEGEKLGKSIEDLVRPRIQFLHLADQTPVTGFEKGYPINYHRDRALDWRKIASADYYGHVLQTSPNPLLNVQMSPGQRMFLVLNRSNEKLALRRGILAYQPETERRGEWRREKEGWVVSLLESETRGLKTSILKQLLAFEKREHEKDRIRQTVPGLAWLELEAAVGAKPDTTLRWWRDWTVPAPALRLEMREWPQNNQPKVTAWFVPDDRDGFFANRQLVVRASRTVPFRKKIGAEGVIGPEIEYIEWKKDQEVEGPKGDYINRDCLVVRVRHPKGRPVWVDLESRPAGIGSDHHYFHDAGSCTCYFYGLNRPEDANLVLIDLDAFKKTAQRVEFAPDTAIAAPRIFVPE